MNRSFTASVKAANALLVHGAGFQLHFIAPIVPLTWVEVMGVEPTASTLRMYPGRPPSPGVSDTRAGHRRCAKCIEGHRWDPKGSS